jgi:hypothetical protein
MFQCQFQVAGRERKRAGGVRVVREREVARWEVPQIHAAGDRTRTACAPPRESAPPAR